MIPVTLSYKEFDEIAVSSYDSMKRKKIREALKDALDYAEEFSLKHKRPLTIKEKLDWIDSTIDRESL